MSDIDTDQFDDPEFSSHDFHAKQPGLDALGRIIERVERHVDHECGKDGRYAFMEEVRVLAGDVFPAAPAGLDVEVELGREAIRLLRRGVLSTWYQTPEMNFRDWQNDAKAFVARLEGKG